MAYRQIQTCWSIAFQNDPLNSAITPSAIKTCFKKSALSLNWSKGKSYGNISYLSKPDVELLKDYIAEQCSYDQPADAYDVLAEAHQMGCNNCIGRSVPLFIIIPDLEKSPIKVQPFVES